MEYKRLKNTYYEKDEVCMFGGRLAVANHSGGLAKGNYVLDTLHGKDSKIGDTVICIKESGDCKVGDFFIVDSRERNTNSIAPAIGTLMGTGRKSLEGWSWHDYNFRVLQPRVAIVTKEVNDHPINSRIIQSNTSISWVLEDNTDSGIYIHTIGPNCEWEDTLSQAKFDKSKWINCKIRVIPETRAAIVAKLKEYGLTNSKGKVDGEQKNNVAHYYTHTYSTGYMSNLDEDQAYVERYFQQHNFTEIFWNQKENDFSNLPIEESNPFKVGDHVKRTKNSTNTFTRGQSKIVVRIDGDQVYYQNSFACHYTDLELVVANQNPCQETHIPAYDKQAIADAQAAGPLFTSYTKDIQMSTRTIAPTEKITIEIDATMIKSQAKPEPYKTPLENTTKSVLLVFNASGDIAYSSLAATAEDIKTAKVNLQKPNYLGYTVRIYKFNKGYTTSIPVIETK